jgi:hypothetical protein
LIKGIECIIKRLPWEGRGKEVSECLAGGMGWFDSVAFSCQFLPNSSLQPLNPSNTSNPFPGSGEENPNKNCEMTQKDDPLESLHVDVSLDHDVSQALGNRM